MILVDTSVWIEHFRGDPRADRLAGLLDEDEVLLHPWVLGELALGGLGPRGTRVIADLRRLPSAPEIRHSEVLDLVSGRRLAGLGIGWVDVHLLASTLVAGCGLWTLDTRLSGAARELGVLTGG